MTSRKIPPRRRRGGIFSIRPWRTLPGWAPPVWALFLCLTLYGQTMPRLILPGRGARAPAAPTGSTMDLTVLALRVAFKPDNDLSTTGNGTFLMDIDSLSVGSVQCDGFLVDPPPHDMPYFDAQLEAMANYFENVSNGKVTFNRDSCRVYPEGNDPIVLEGTMASYRSVADEDSSDALLVALFAESLLAAAGSGIGVLDYDMVVVFHAGLGQDFAYDFLDPTPLDIPSATIDSNMVLAALGTSGILLPDSTLFDRPGILLPEGQNHIYYDIVEDVFPGETDYCDMQIGLTGTFALLVGYALGFPPLFDTENGVTSVGVFGLMDVGSNNGQGVIPAPPSAWTRVFLGWEVAEELEGDFALAARHLDEGQVGRISLSTSEYFLVENRLNWVPGLPGVDLDSLRYRNRTPDGSGSYTLPPYFDYLVDSAGVDTASGVITAVPNYDLGLPGSGLLIWHVDESRYRASMQGINDDPQARAVALVEADGAVDIGFPTTAIFGDPTQGWRWDLWYAGNEDFFRANPDREANNPQGLLSFDSDTRPSTHLNSGAASGVAVSKIGPADSTLNFTVGDENVTRLPEGSRLLGYNGEKWLYARGDSLYMAGADASETFVAILISTSSLIVSESDPVVGDASSAFWVVDSTQAGYTAQRYRGNGSPYPHPPLSDTIRVEALYFNDGLLFIGMRDSVLPDSPDTTYIEYYQVRYEDGLPVITSWGYLNDNETRSPIILGPPGEDGVDPGPNLAWVRSIPPSLADVDGDGLDEIVAFTYRTRTDILEFVPTYRMIAVNSNGTVLDGFPVHGNVTPNPVLIANLMDDIDDIRPELVVVESGDIAIYSYEGRLLDRLGLHADPSELFLLHTADGRVGLANGDRIHWFDPDEQNPQWVTPQGRHSRSRYSLNDGEHLLEDQPAILDKARVYNYPNPVTEGRTTIRFYTGQATRATIRIYTVDGLLVTKKELTDLATNDYNEWRWDVGNNPSGLYYAVVEVKGADKVSALVKIAVVR